MNDFPLKYSEANQPGRFRPIPTKIKFKPTDLMKRMGKRCGCRLPTEMRTARLLSRMVHFSSLALFFNIQLENQESNWEVIWVGVDGGACRPLRNRFAVALVEAARFLNGLLFCKFNKN
jgi:hypothetical protein